MPDFNPDREGHRKHKWVVHKATTAKIDSVQTSKGDLKLNKEGRAVIKDEALAAEIRSGEMGKRDLCVTRVTADDPADQGHRYHFGQFPGLPWAKYDELGRRIPDPPKEQQDG
jgi:hypothetical protein